MSRRLITFRLSPDKIDRLDAAIESLTSDEKRPYKKQEVLEGLIDHFLACSPTGRLQIVDPQNHARLTETKRLSLLMEKQNWAQHLLDHERYLWAITAWREVEELSRKGDGIWRICQHRLIFAYGHLAVQLRDALRPPTPIPNREAAPTEPSDKSYPRIKEEYVGNNRRFDEYFRLAKLLRQRGVEHGDAYVQEAGHAHSVHMYINLACSYSRLAQYQLENALYCFLFGKKDRRPISEDEEKDRVEQMRDLNWRRQLSEQNLPDTAQIDSYAHATIDAMKNALDAAEADPVLLANTQRFLFGNLDRDLDFIRYDEIYREHFLSLRPTTHQDFLLRAVEVTLQNTSVLRK